MNDENQRSTPSANGARVRTHANSVKSTASDGHNDSEQLLVLSYRDHHNAYTASDGSGAIVVHHSRPTSLVFAIKQFLFSVAIVHYLLYWVPVAGFLFLVYRAGYWPVIPLLIVLYLPSYFDRAQFKTGRAWDWFRANPLWYFSHHYCELEIVRHAALDPKRRYIFACHPHGILIISRIGLYGGTFERLFPKIDTRTLGASPMFWVPFAREICLWMGAVDAGKGTANKILHYTNPDTHLPMSMFIYPGGSKEIFETDPDSTVTTIIARKGFIRLALERECDIVPMFVFGEKWMYHVIQPSKRVVDFMLSCFKTPVLLFYGRFFSWLPYFSPMSLVFDRPIDIAQYRPDTSQPVTEAQVEAVYREYYKRVEELYNRYKRVYGYADKETIRIVHG